MLKRAMTVLIVAALAAMVGAAAVVYVAAAVWRSPSAREVEIAPGSSLQRIARELSGQGVIRAPTLFAAIARAKGAGVRLKAGTYSFPAGTTLIAALDKIERGDVIQYPFTVIEGWTIREIAAELDRQPFARGMGSQFMALAADRSLAAELGIPGRSLEGHLFPDTYLVSKPASAEALIRRMVARFKEVWNEVLKEAGGGADLKMDEAVTLASIVEEETGVAGERPIVASVFLNRLKIGMPLQSDPTIIYGLTDYDGDIRRRDILNPHPYNTYVHPGLPPGPICNPGRASLVAAVMPAQTRYLYFVSRNDGTHAFSESLSEHQRAVERYQISGGGARDRGEK